MCKWELLWLDQEEILYTIGIYLSRAQVSVSSLSVHRSVLYIGNLFIYLLYSVVVRLCEFDLCMGKWEPLWLHSREGSRGDPLHHRDPSIKGSGQCFFFCSSSVLYVGSLWIWRLHLVVVCKREKLKSFPRQTWRIGRRLSLFQYKL